LSNCQLLPYSPVAPFDKGDEGCADLDRWPSILTVMGRGSWGKSKQLTTKSWGIVKQNRYLLAFPLLGFFASLIPLAILWIPAALFFAADNYVPGVILAVAGIFVTQIVVSIASGGLIAAADEELAGRDSSIGHGIGASLARLFPLIGWAFIQTIMSIIVGAIRGNGQGGAASVVRNIAASGILAMWSLITFFVLPFVMLERVGPITAIKESAKLFKAKWGMQIFGGVRIGGVVALITILPAILIIVLGVVVTLSNLPAVGIPLIAIGVIIFAIGVLLLATLRGIFSVVLFRYAKDGALEGGFTEEELAGAVRTKA
jgi:hypothetical protein